MKDYIKSLSIFLLFILPLFLSAQTTYNSPNNHTYTVPTTGDLTVTMKGGNGTYNFFNNSQLGGTGAQLQATFSVQTGDVLLLAVGGAGSSGDGGGGSALILTRGATSTLLMVAGGGGGGGIGNPGKGGNSADGTPGGGSNGSDLANGAGGGGFNTNGANGSGPGNIRNGGTMGTLNGGAYNVSGGGYGFGSGGDSAYGGGGGGGYGGGNGGNGGNPNGQGGDGGTSYIETSGTNGFVGTNITRTDGTDGGANGGNGFITISGSATLPVELTYFKGKSNVEGNLMTWQTASENNNEGFEIQRSIDGKSWETLDFVFGNGTTIEVSNYEFIDNQPFVGTNYYRLKQIDFDGAFEYSNIINLTTEQSDSYRENHPTISIFPNPVQNELNIIGGQGQATIYNMLGQPVKQFTVSDENSFINVADLPKGQYVLHIQSQEIEETIVVKRFVK